MSLLGDKDSIKTSTVTNLAGVSASTAYTAIGIGVPAVLTFPGVPGKSYRLKQMEWSYNMPAASGTVTVQDGIGNVVWNIDDPNAGSWTQPITPDIVGTPGAAMIITLSSGGPGVTGKINARPFPETAV